MDSLPERRRFRRVNYSCKVKIRKENSDSLYITDTENISVSGVCLKLPENIKVGTSVDLEINLMDQKPPLKCKGKVIWGLYHPPNPIYSHGVYFNGIELSGVSPEDNARINKIVELYSGGENS